MLSHSSSQTTSLQNPRPTLTSVAPASWSRDWFSRRPSAFILFAPSPAGSREIKFQSQVSVLTGVRSWQVYESYLKKITIFPELEWERQIAKYKGEIFYFDKTSLCPASTLKCFFVVLSSLPFESSLGTPPKALAEVGASAEAQPSRGRVSLQATPPAWRL